ncbi:ParA family protein [Paracoccus bogoriensis]|uniref:ParA family protein n=1 Tax=Paracoccus bogoriensis TaxID=242065 RepID=UPI001C67EA49|nr:ParA family protein [Paracoccus bogoriensis]MBW7055324.1 ParA family protein [Paracoccus bogoriensis]
MPDAHILAIANQKGGVGKTTTAINLGAALSEMGHEVILIDLDPQGNASTGLGIDPKKRSLSSFDLLTGDVTLQAGRCPTAFPRLSIVPATSDLSSADAQLSQRSDRLRLLSQALRSAPAETIILIDCPPALGLLTVNAMVAADAVLVPLQAEFYALEGLSQLLTTVREVRSSANPTLRINGVVLTMSDNRNNLSQQVEADARATLGDLVYATVIPRNVRVSESPSHAMPVLNYDPQSKGSLAYRQLAAEFAARLKLPEVVS